MEPVASESTSVPNSPLRVLFLPRYSALAGSSRYLTYDYIPYYEAQGVVCDVAPLLDDRYLLYGQARRRGEPTESRIGLGLHLAANACRRLWKVLHARRYDVVVLEKDLFPYLPYLFEALLFALNRRVVSLYDEATHVYYREGGPFVRWLTSGKIARIIRNSRAVVVWNNTMRAYAERLNSDVTVVSTGIDTERYQPKNDYSIDQRPVRIGWMGQTSGFEYLHMLDGVLQRLSRTYPLELLVVSSEDYRVPGVQVSNRRWSVQTEVGDLQAMDIGIMPLPQTEWAAGKSGCKMLQYMGVATPVVVSPVGINAEIVADETKGLCATTEEEWYNAIVRLIEDQRLRETLGSNGRRHIEQHNSQQAMARTLLAVIRRAAGRETT